MSSANFLGLLLVLVFPHVSCSSNYEGRSAGSIFQAFNSYIPNQNQDTLRSYAAPGYGQPSQSLYHVKRLSSHDQPTSNTASLPVNGATAYPASGVQYKTNSEFGKLYGDRSKSSLTTPLIVSSGGIVIVQDPKDSQESHKPDKPLAAKKPLTRHNASSRLRSSNLSNSFRDRWSSGTIWSGSTSSDSLNNEPLGYLKHRKNENKNSYNPVSQIPSFSVFSNANGQAPVSRSNNQEMGSAYPVKKLLQTAAQAHFGLPQAPRCVTDIPATYGLGAIRRCPRLDSSTQTSTQSYGSSESSLNWFPQSYPPNRLLFTGKTAGYSTAVQTSHGTTGRMSSASNGPASLRTGSGGNQLVPGVTQTGNTNQAIVPSQHMPSSRAAHLFYPRHKHENTRSGDYVVTRDVPKFTNSMQSHYGTPMLGTAAQPGNYLTVKSGSLPSFSMSGSESQPVSTDATSPSFDTVNPVSDPYRTSQRSTGAWTSQPSDNGSSSGSNGYTQRFLSSNIPAAPHRTRAAGLYRVFSAVSGDEASRRLKYPEVTFYKQDKAF